mgnify:CR=1 FL=1
MVNNQKWWWRHRPTSLSLAESAPTRSSCCKLLREIPDMFRTEIRRELTRNGAQRRATESQVNAHRRNGLRTKRNETKRNETKWTATQRTESISFRFSSLQFSSFRFVSFRRSALTCARTELQRTATNRFWTVLGRRDPVLSTNQSRAECRFAENSRRIIQFRRILETAMCRLPYLTHSRDYNYRRKCFIETQI